MYPYPLTYNSLTELFASTTDRRYTHRRKLANHTYVFNLTTHDSREYRVRLHSTDILTFTAGSVRLYAGGWLTPTTKQRLNQTPYFCISQENGQWFIHLATEYDPANIYPHIDWTRGVPWNGEPVTIHADRFPLVVTRTANGNILQPVNIHDYVLELKRAARASSRPPANGLYYKLVAVDPVGRMVSVYDGQTEYHLARPMRELARQNHRGGFYCYATAAQAYNADVQSCARTSQREYTRAVISLQCERPSIRYGDKLAFTTVTPLDVIDASDLTRANIHTYTASYNETYPQEPLPKTPRIPNTPRAKYHKPITVIYHGNDSRDHTATITARDLPNYKDLAPLPAHISLSDFCIHKSIELNSETGEVTQPSPTSWSVTHIPTGVLAVSGDSIRDAAEEFNRRIRISADTPEKYNALIAGAMHMRAKAEENQNQEQTK